MQKTIHVNAYKKRDGTQVKEHDRIIDVVLNPKGCYPQEPELPRVDVPDVIMNMAPVLEGGVSVDVYPQVPVVVKVVAWEISCQEQEE